MFVHATQSIEMGWRWEGGDRHYEMSGYGVQFSLYECLGNEGSEKWTDEVVMDETHLHNFRKLGLAVTEEGHGHHDLPCSPHMGWRLTHSPKRSGVHQMRHQRIHPSSSSSP
jgi:hypothetical protein